MTIKELLKTLEQRKKGLSYVIWKQANLIGASMSKGFPDTPERANPELYPPTPTIKRPDWLTKC